MPLSWHNECTAILKIIVDEDVECLLELGDRFDMHFMLDECERYLLKYSNETDRKLFLADRYKLMKLQVIHFSQFFLNNL